MSKSLHSGGAATRPQRTSIPDEVARWYPGAVIHSIVHDGGRVFKTVFLHNGERQCIWTGGTYPSIEETAKLPF